MFGRIYQLKKKKKKRKQTKTIKTSYYHSLRPYSAFISLTRTYYCMILYCLLAYFLYLSITLQYKVFEDRKFVHSWLTLHAYKMFLVHNKSSINIFQVIIKKDKFTERKMARSIEDMGGLHRVLMKGKNSWWKWSQS